MLTLRTQLKVYHWQTGIFSRHKASDELGEKLDANIDKFVETYIGKYGRPKFTAKNQVIHIRIYNDSEASKLLREAVQWLTRLNIKDTDMLNIRDEIVADLHQTLYLFTLHP